MSSTKDVSPEYAAKKAAKKRRKRMRRIRRHIFNTILFFSLGLFIGMHWKAIRALVIEKKLPEAPKECPWSFFKV